MAEVEKQRVREKEILAWPNKQRDLGITTVDVAEKERLRMIHFEPTDKDAPWSG